MKRWMSLLLALTMVLSLFPVSAFAEGDEAMDEPAYSGTIGDAITYALSDDGILAVTGSGPIPDYSDSNPAPWSRWAESATALTIGDGITAVGARAFRNLTALTGALTIPDSVKTIGENAFSGCSSLTGLELGNGITSIGQSAFSSCSGMKGDLVIQIGRAHV